MAEWENLGVTTFINKLEFIRERGKYGNYQ